MTFLIPPRAFALVLSFSFFAALTARGELVPLNLALDKPTTASASQANQEPSLAIDGDDATRWCAADSSAGHWWQVDLEKPRELTSFRVKWEFDDARYQYKVDGSPDGKAWTTLLDRTAPDAPAQRDHTHQLANAEDVRFLRVTVTGLEEGRWASFHEFQVFGREMVDASRVVRDKRPALLREIKAPAGMKVTIFAAP